jgi:hypothetical protein
VAEARTESSGLMFHLHLVTKHQTKELDSDNSNDYRDADSSDEDAESSDVNRCTQQLDGLYPL